MRIRFCRLLLLLGDNTSRIDAVILRGQLLDRAALDAMLAKVKQR